ncbi:MAG: SRPBCC family protein [Myxococcota bacterium]
MTRLGISIGMAALFMACSSAASGTGVNSSSAEKASEAIPIAKLTNAPRRVSAMARLNSPLKQVWRYLGVHQNLLEYSNGVLGKVTIDTTGAQGENGVGTKRQCETSDGSGKFVERIVYYKAPYAFAYSAVENTWGLQDHLATVTLKPDGDGTIVQWDQYFNHVKPEMTPMMAENIEGMLKGKILSYLTGKFGGEVLGSR